MAPAIEGTTGNTLSVSFELLVWGRAVVAQAMQCNLDLQAMLPMQGPGAMKRCIAAP